MPLVEQINKAISENLEFSLIQLFDYENCRAKLSSNISLEALRCPTEHYLNLSMDHNPILQWHVTAKIMLQMMLHCGTKKGSNNSEIR